MSPTSVPASPPEVGVLIPAAGRGDRAGVGALKQFRAIGGVPMLLRAIRPFAQHPRVRQIVVALPAEFVTAPPPWLDGLVGARLRTVPGGETRAASVRAALAALEPACTLVLVHDAARPFVSPGEIDAIIEAAAQGAALLAVPVSDTLKAAGDGPLVRRTVARDGLWRALTPQGFPRAVLEAAYARTSDAEAATDDAALVEALGQPVRLVPGRTTNLKITTPEDFELAEALARR
ncbi:MAG: 2-C-methyl-D-erythritol 4-phosphate cytidylyltransferase [Gemmatimonadota bacterium]|nr:2-C-methyl-D-erythritol 4-phosphate cytidylyltransferase [Gemmatimonadota bacterium]